MIFGSPRKTTGRSQYLVKNVAIKGVENGELMETIRLAIWRIIQTSFEFFSFLFFSPQKKKEMNLFGHLQVNVRPPEGVYFIPPDAG